MRQGRNLVSNSDFNRKRGEEYLKSSYGRFADGSNASVLISSSFASENIVGGGQLRSNSRRLGCELASHPYSASSRSYKGRRSNEHLPIKIGGEGNYASLMSSNFAGTETMLNPDHIVGGGRNPLEASASGMQAELVFLDSSIQKGGKPFNRLAPYTRNDLQKGGAGLTVCTPFHYEGGVC